MAAEKKTNLRPSNAGNGAGSKEAKAKTAALEAAVTQIERQFGQGSVMRLGDKAHIPVETIPTGALSLDLALGVGGVPRGRIVEIFGPESSGKTTLVYHIIAEAQARGGVCAFVDAEHALDPIYAKRIGVNTEELLISQPDHGEQRSRSSTSWSARAPSTLSPSTRSRRSPRGPSSRGRWGRPRSACRRG